MKKISLIKIILLSLLFAPVLNVKAQDKSEMTVSKNIYLDDTDCSGMTKTEIEALINKRLAELNKKTVKIKANDREMDSTGEMLGIEAGNAKDSILSYGKIGNPLDKAIKRAYLKKGKKKFSLSVHADADKIKAFLNTYASQLTEQPVDNSLTRENGQFVFVEGKKGYSVNIDKAVPEIVSYVDSKWGKGGEIELPVEEKDPRGTKEELSNVKDLLGTATTDYSSSAAGRKVNVAHAASFMNGTIMYPGDTVSVFNKVSPITLENGYKNAGVYVNGQVVDGEGGGVCQVATTTYDAVLQAELEIVTRSCHSMMVHYVDVSMDAAIASSPEGKALKDLQFKNNTDYPVYIEEITNGNTITVNIYGKETRQAGRTVTYEPEILEATEITHQYTADPSLPVGTIKKTSSGSIGYKARLWKIVTVNGVEESRKIMNRSTYKMQSEADQVGVASSDPTRTDRMNKAIETKDENTVNSTAQALAAEEGTTYSVPSTPKSDLYKKKQEEAASQAGQAEASSDQSAAENQVPGNEAAP
jgi:vancomycin resistance protein YoaR